MHNYCFKISVIISKKYTIKYTATFISQFNNILKYFMSKLDNKIAAENFYMEVI